MCASKALEPRLDLEWVADCEKHGLASFKGSKVTLKMSEILLGRVSGNTIQNGLTPKLTLKKS